MTAAAAPRDWHPVCSGNGSLDLEGLCLSFSGSREHSGPSLTTAHTADTELLSTSTPQNPTAQGMGRQLLLPCILRGLYEPQLAPKAEQLHSSSCSQSSLAADSQHLQCPSAPRKRCQKITGEPCTLNGTAYAMKNLLLLKVWFSFDMTLGWNRGKGQAAILPITPKLSAIKRKGLVHQHQKHNSATTSLQMSWSLAGHSHAPTPTNRGCQPDLSSAFDTEECFKDRYIKRLKNWSHL